MFNISSINLMNFYKRWIRSESKLIWSVVAKRSLWKRGLTSDLPRSNLPEIGSEYLIIFDGGDIKIGEPLNIEYSSASAYLNGVETVADLDSMRIFGGIIKSYAPSKPTDNHMIEFDTEATFEIQSARSLSDFAKLPAVSVDDLVLWQHLRGGHFYNLTNLGEYILLSWASDSYAGADCFVQRKNGKLYVLRCHEWQEEYFSQLYYGRVIVPSILTERINRRLFTLEHGAHWAGDSI